MESSLRSRIELVLGDIVDEDTDAIVNAANISLLGGGGVDGAIHRAAGSGLVEECRKLGGCPTGEARITRGHALKARHVIHAVGPMYRDGKQGEATLLASAYRACLALAQSHTLRTVSFPAISTGVYGYPKEAAARIAVSMVTGWLGANPFPVSVRFVLFSEPDLDVYTRVLGETP